MKKISLSRLRTSRFLLLGKPPVRRPSLEPQTLHIRPEPHAPKLAGPRVR